MSNSKVKVNQRLSIPQSHNVNEILNHDNRSTLKKLLHNRFQVKLGQQVFNEFKNMIASEISKIVSSPKIKSENITKLYHSINNEIQKSNMKEKSEIKGASYYQVDNKKANLLEGSSIEKSTLKNNNELANDKINKMSLSANNQDIDILSESKKTSYKPFRVSNWNKLIEYNTYLDKLEKLQQKEIIKQKRRDISESLQTQVNEKYVRKTKELNEDQLFDSALEKRLKYVKDLDYINKMKKEVSYYKSKEEREKEYKEFILHKNRKKNENRDKEKKEVEDIIKLFEEENTKIFEKKRRTKEILIKYRKENEENQKINRLKFEQEKSRDIKDLEMNLKFIASQNLEEEKLHQEKRKKLKKILDFSTTLSNTNSNFFKYKYKPNFSHIETLAFKNKFENARNYKDNMIQSKFSKGNQSTEFDALLLKEQLEKENQEYELEDAKRKQKRKNEEENVKQIEIQVQEKKQKELKEKKSDEEFMKKIREDYNCFLKEEKSKLELTKIKSKSYYEEVKKQIEQNKSKVIPEMTENEYLINKRLLDSADRSLWKIEKIELSPSSTFYK